MELYVLQNGTIQMQPSTFVADRVPDYEGETIPAPVPVYLIRDEDKTILFDTGTEGSYEGLKGLDIPEEQHLAYYLDELGLEPCDVTDVVCSHLHIDHTGKLHLFQDAQVLVHADEYHHAQNLLATQTEDYVYPLDRIEKWNEANLNWKLLDGKFDRVPLTPHVEILTLGPGHAAGMLGLLVRPEHSAPKLIVSDAAYCRENFYPEPKLPGIVHDPEGYLETIHYLDGVAQEENAEIWYGHDMQTFLDLVRYPDSFYS